MNAAPFTPLSFNNTRILIANVAAPAGISVGDAGQVEFYNDNSGVTAFIGVGTSAAAATAAAVAPVGTTAGAIPIGPLQRYVLTIANANSTPIFFSAVAASAVNLYLTAGTGA